MVLLSMVKCHYGLCLVDYLEDNVCFQKISLVRCYFDFVVKLYWVFLEKDHQIQEKQ